MYPLLQREKISQIPFFFWQQAPLSLYLLCPQLPELFVRMSQLLLSAKRRCSVISSTTIPIRRWLALPKIHCVVVRGPCCRESLALEPGLFVCLSGGCTARPRTPIGGEGELLCCCCFPSAALASSRCFCPPATSHTNIALTFTRCTVTP